MKNNIVAILIAIIFLFNKTQAQVTTENGIHFQSFTNWQAALKEAKQQNRPIFVDCYATWCGPCKAMEKDVYAVDSIGKFFNAHFICVKVQMDSTANDNEQVRGWYADARNMQHTYRIDAFPSYLFFSPEGKAAHKNIGYMGASNFSALGHFALDTDKQYYTRVEKFKQKMLTYTTMPDLVQAARWNNDFELADQISKTYINDYLLKLSPGELYTVDNLAFIGNFMTKLGTQSAAFELFYHSQQRIDSTFKTRNFSSGIIDQTISNDELSRYMYKDSKPFHFLNGPTPDWIKIHGVITKKYNLAYADRIVLWNKILWLEHEKNWPEYTKNVMLKIEKYGPYNKYKPYSCVPEPEALNSSAWDIFNYSNDPKELAKATDWAEKATKISSDKDMFYLEYIDTYANLLYRRGRTAAAITMEEKAAAKATWQKEVKENLVKMKKGEKTWSQ